MDVYQGEDVVIEALCYKPYATNMLEKLIERDTFKKITNFVHFQKCLDDISQFELERLSKKTGNEEKFLVFLRYVNLLNETDERRLNGNLLIERIF